MNDSQYQAEETAQKSSKLCTASMILGIVADVLLCLLCIFGNISRDIMSRFLGGYSGIMQGGCVIGGVSTWEMIFLFAYSLMGLVMLICSFIGTVLAICSLVSRRPKKGRALIGLLCNGIVVGLCLLSFFLSLAKSGGGEPSLPSPPFDIKTVS